MRDIPRPGHADMATRIKYGGFSDFRGGVHFSGRLTAPIVAAGAIAKKVVAPARIEARLLEAGGSSDIETAVEQALEERDSIGGLIGCSVDGLPAGLGEPFFDSAESLLSHAMFAIPAVKGIEFGAGFACARMKGSECNDEIIDESGRTRTNRAGGISGGITNGNDLLFQVAIKPTSSIGKARASVDLRSGKKAIIEPGGRHDACIALRAPVIVEAMAAIVLADLMLIEQERGRLSR